MQPVLLPQCDSLSFQIPDGSGEIAMDVEEGGVSFQFPYWKPLRRRLRPDDPLFAAGNIERELLEKQVALNMPEEEKQHIRSFEDWGSGTAFCPIVGCGSRLKSLVDFEDHYNARHTASCSVCSRVYPTSRLLSIHVSEAHDSFFQAKVARGYAMYECLVEGCGAKLKSYKNRQQHLVDKHKFPSSFEFFKKANPSKKHRQNAKSKQSLGNTGDNSTAMQVEKEEDMEELISGVSRLSTSDSPLTISFGRRRNHGLGFVPRSLERERRPDQVEK